MGAIIGVVLILWERRPRREAFTRSVPGQRLQLAGTALI